MPQLVEIAAVLAPAQGLLAAVGLLLPLSARLRGVGLGAALAGAAAPALVVAGERGWLLLPPQLLLPAWGGAVLLALLFVALGSREERPLPGAAWTWLAAVLALDLGFAAALLWFATVSPGGV